MHQPRAKGDFEMTTAKKSEVGAVLQVFRVLTAEEQRIAYAFIEGMRTQKAIEEQSSNECEQSLSKRES